MAAVGDDELGPRGGGVGILVQGMGSSSSGGGAESSSGRGRDWPEAEPELVRRRGFGAGRSGAELTSSALGQVALQQVEIGRFLWLLRPRGAIGCARGGLEELSEQRRVP
ncbi:hypothetical protein MC885_017490 [Smutsia gigantea]|nr:hypothetical protein MC885_017490 [Smutsia gigantea]